MPIHDWSRVPAGLFHDFHQTWTIHIKSALNAGRLPSGLTALVEQRAGPKIGDVLAVESKRRRQSMEGDGGGLITLEPPETRIVQRTTKEIYAVRANRIVVRHHVGRIVAVIEIVSPGNKDSRASFREFVDKAVDFLRQGVHLLIVDLFPPTPRDPLGIHKAIWDEITDEVFDFPPGKDRILAAYESGGERVAYVEPIAVGDVLIDMPLFLASGMHVKVPLEATYQSAWETSTPDVREIVETGILPEVDADET